MPFPASMFGGDVSTTSIPAKPTGIYLPRSYVFHTRPSTSVPRKFESILYPESYCSLGPTRIHSLFD
jgi:hypothetical protein